MFKQNPRGQSLASGGDETKTRKGQEAIERESLLKLSGNHFKLYWTTFTVTETKKPKSEKQHLERF